ncbi:Copper metallochaperone, bacterial analog of Cox17 protein [Rubrivivax sp. A210]|uniref:copper chaperone PCu(A)C n=1 Tax=Rubrivivax sp. A210 TaxID=2772301 RepID=UPI00191B22A8|nr:copper chaperone PCu(A)C [Rubrivivax sp. A210]CAD5371311.1 Copper metallochaperone, bacterial analog of Cox17 protein [Rubrivivax sp. A210]
MNATPLRRQLLRTGLALGAALALPAARACEFTTGTLRVTHPWTRASDGDTAVLCMKFDEVVEADRLVLVETPIATRAEMAGELALPHVDFLIPAGQTVHLEEAGTYVRLLGLRFPLELGRSYPLRLGFEKAGVFKANLTVDYGRFR